MKTYDFAIAAKSFDKPSETFIRLHATQLAPGRTVYLAADQTASAPPCDDAPGLWGYRNDVRGRAQRLGLRSSSVTAFLKAHQVKVLLAEYGSVGRMLRPYARRSGVPFFVHFHGSDATSAMRTGINRWKHQALFREATGFFAPSEFIKTKLVTAGCPGNKIVVSPCGVAPEKFQLSRREAGRLLAVGRFVPKKAPMTLLTAFATAAASEPGLHLDYIGDGALLDEAKEFAVTKGLGSQVTFHGAQPHDTVQRLMSRASIFLQHSVTAPDGDTEGLPVAILEAMAAGIPVVSTRHSGIPEAVLDGETGYLVDEHDAVAMSEAILRVARLSEHESTRMAHLARARIELHFTAERSLQTLRGTMGL